MPITGQGWEMLVVRKSVQTRKSGRSKIRTVGSYQVFHNGNAQTRPGMFGTIAESKGPGKNAPAGNGHRIETGRYQLATQDGARYKTWNYDESGSIGRNPKPGLLVVETGQRTGILVHPGKGSFLCSTGCFNPSNTLPHAAALIEYEPSRALVIAIIEDLKSFAGDNFPQKNGRRIPNAFIVVEGEP
jgi:hypothetical protein